MTNRQPAGIPVGGQFATDAKARSGVGLPGSDDENLDPAWAEHGFTDAQAHVWGKAGIQPYDAQGWTDRGVDEYEAAAWAAVGITDPTVGKAWMDNGHTPDSAAELLERGVVEPPKIATPATPAGTASGAPVVALDGDTEAYVAWSHEDALGAGVPRGVLDQVNPGRPTSYVVAASPDRRITEAFLVDTEEFETATAGGTPFVIDPTRHARLLHGSGGKQLATNPNAPVADSAPTAETMDGQR